MSVSKAMLFFTFLLICASASADIPETIVLYPTDGQIVRHSDIAAWWVGIPSEGSALEGFYYSLDNAAPVFTTSNSVRLWRLEDGEHTLRVYLIDSSLTQDETPAEVNFIVSATTQLESETNDTPDQASIFGAGINIQGVSLTFKQDIDWYKLYVPDGVTSTTLAFRRDEGIASTEIAIFANSPDEQFRISTLQANPNNRQRAAVTIGTDPGTILFVKVTPSTAETSAPYILSASSIERSDVAAWETENNSEPDNATPVPIGDKTYYLIGKKDAETDTDWYRLSFSHTDSRMLSLNLSRLGSTAETEIEVFRGSLINDLSKVASCKATYLSKGSANASFLVTFGDYFVKVQDTGEQKGSYYQLVFSLADEPPAESYELEPNTVSPAEQPGYSSQLIVEKGISGYNWGDADQDWFHFDVGKIGILGISLFRENAIGKSSLSLFNRNFVELASFQINPNTDQTGNVYLEGITPGRYFIRIDSEGEKPSSRYRLNAFLVGSVTHNAADGLTLGDSLNAAVDWVTGGEVSLTLVGDFPDKSTADRFRNLPLGETSPGKYRLKYPLKEGDSVDGATAIFSFRTAEGDELTYAHPEPANLRAGKAISDILHTGDHLLKVGDTLEVSMTSIIKSGVASFDIVGLRSDLTMHGDGAGRYVGEYTVADGDTINNALIKGRIVDLQGNTYEIESAIRVSIDAQAPKPPTELQAVDRPNDNGFQIDVSWKPSESQDLSLYRVYLSEAQTTSTVGLTLMSETRATQITVPVDRNDFDYYLAVTAVDFAGNESQPIFAAPVAAKDNLAPVAKSFSHDAPPTVSLSDPTVRFQVVSEQGIKADLTIPGFAERLPLQEVDGLYVVDFSFPEGVEKTDILATITLTDTSGNKRSVVVPPPIDVDTKKPAIESIVHDGTAKNLKEGDFLVVELKGETGNKAWFEISGSDDQHRLYDDGKHGDGAAGDGLYSGSYEVKDGDRFVGASLTGFMEDAAGNVNSIVAVSKIDIDATPPRIVSAVVNGNSFKLGDIVRIEVVGDTFAQGVFRIGKREGTLFDDGKHGDGEANDGVYVGTYLVEEGILLTTVPLVVQLAKPNGKIASLEIGKVTVDGDPPPEITDVQASDVPNDEGNRVHVSWSKSNVADLQTYLVYISSENVASLDGLSPILASTESLTLTVERNNLEYYVAVVAKDKAGNLSPVGQSSIARVVALDNLAPPEPNGVSASTETPGKISLSWIYPNRPADWRSFNIYLSENESLSDSRRFEITHSQARNADIDVEPNRTVYFGIASQDVNGNESKITVIGPVESVDQQAKPTNIVSMPQGIIRGNNALISVRNWGEPFSYVVDGTRYQTDRSTVYLRNLSMGSHRVSIEIGSEKVSSEFQVVPMPLDISESGKTTLSGIQARGAGDIVIVLPEDATLNIVSNSPDAGIILDDGSGRIMTGEGMISLKAGSYRLQSDGETTVYTTPVATDVESNDVFPEMIEVNQLLIGRISHESDIDRYRVAMSAGSRLALTVISADGVNLTVRDRQNMPVEMESISLASVSHYLSPPLEAGSLEIEVTGSVVSSYQMAIIELTELSWEFNDIARAGDTVRLRADWRGVGEISAEMIGLFPRMPLAPPEGVAYTVKDGDEIQDGVITLWFGIGDETVPFRVPGVSVNVDTIPPKITLAQHDVSEPLTAGDTISVEVIADPSNIGWFSIPDVVDESPLIEETPGVYRGEYEIRKGDDVSKAMLICYLSDFAGNMSSIQAKSKTIGRDEITIDTVPPVISDISLSGESPLIEGEVLRVKVVSEPGLTGWFDIGEFRTELPLKEENDGKYVGEYSVKPGDYAATVRVIAHMVDSAGNESVAESADVIDIDTLPPEIVSVTHDATGTLKRDSVLRITAQGTPDCDARAAIIGVVKDIFMNESDGVYTADYRIKSGDDMTDARVSVTLTKRNGKSAMRFANNRISIDTIAPPSITDVQVTDVALDEGFNLNVFWKPIALEDFHSYRIYRSSRVILSVKGMNAIDEIREISASQITINVPQNNSDYYIAVTAVDRAGNESELMLSQGGSMFGPVRALDNLAPPPVTGITAGDRPNDFGGVILIRWDSPSPVEDFASYNVYISNEPLIDRSKIKPIKITNQSASLYEAQTVDGVDYYFAVTASDKSGNESKLMPESVIGPVRSKKDILTGEIAPPEIRSAPLGTTLSNMTMIHLSRWITDDIQPVKGYLWSIDGGPESLSEDGDIALFSLVDGEHLFVARPVGLSGTLPVQWTFNVIATDISETEPNDSPAEAMKLHPEVPVKGNNMDDSDVDWFAVDVTDPGVMDVMFQREIAVGDSEIAVFTETNTDDPIARISTGKSQLGRGWTTVGVVPGRYLIRVSGWSETPLSEYRLLASVYQTKPEHVFEIEPNNGEQTAQPLTVNDGVELVGFGSAGDQDWFIIDSPSAGMLLESGFVAGDESARIGVFYGAPSKGGKRVDEVRVSAKSGSGNSSLVLRSGRYYLVVDQFSADAAYSVKLITSPSKSDMEVEPNDETIDANATSVGAEILGRCYSEDDVDRYVIQVNSSGILGLGLNMSDTSGRFILSMDSLDGTRLAEIVADQSRLGEAFFDVETNPGKYLITVKAEGVDQGYYRFRTALIRARSHDALEPIGIGEVLTVKVSPTVEMDASLTLPGIVEELPMTRTGTEYVAQYTVARNDQLTGLPYVSVRLPGFDGEVRFTIEDIIIDTLAPRITEITHNAQKPLPLNAILRVTMTGDPGAIAYFDIQGDSFHRRIEMQETEGGKYEGEYQVAPGEDIFEATVTGYLEDEVGNLSQKTTFFPVTFDTVPPVIESTSVFLSIDGSDFRHADQFAKGILGEGDKIRLEVLTEKGITGFAAIEGFKEEIRMRDDGIAPDASANDGIFTALYTVRNGDFVSNAPVRFDFTDKAGNSETVYGSSTVTIDAVPPTIDLVTHDGDRPLKRGDVLTVYLHGQAGNRASFNIANRTDSNGDLIRYPMVDDGTGHDETRDDGIYTGVYEVKPDDNIRNGVLIGFLIDENGNEMMKFSSKPLNLDSELPDPVTGVQAEDKADDEGYVLLLSWDPTTDPDFDHYNVYRETKRITITTGLIPVRSNLVLPQMTGVEIPVPSNNTDYYLAVTVVDKAGNESLIRAGSWTGPIQSLDNITPDPVTKVVAEDYPNDQGKTIIVKWDTASTAADFDHYNVYVSIEEIVSLEELEPATVVNEREMFSAKVAVEKDNVPYNVAVTAVDKSGNESGLDPSGNSVWSGVVAVDNIPPEPVVGVYSYDAPGDDGGSIIVEWTPVEDASVTENRIYISFSQITGITDLGDLEFISVDPSQSRSAVDVISDTAVYVAVTSLDSGGNESPLSSESVWGPTYATSNRIISTRKTKIYAGFDPRISVSIPAGAGGEGELIDIFIPTDPEIVDRLEEANRSSALEISFIDPEYEKLIKDTDVLFSYTGGELLRNVEVSLSYPEFTDNPDVENRVRIFRLNENSPTGVWELLPGMQTVDIENNVITAEVDHLSVFRVAVLKLPTTLDKVEVFPNPFISSQSSTGRVTFVNLPEMATILIYTLTGSLVKKIEVEPMTGRAFWNLRNEHGAKVGRGMYVYVVKGRTGTVKGRVVVLE